MIDDKQILLLLIASLWTVFTLQIFISSWFTAKRYGWHKIKGYWSGQICLVFAHISFGIAIWSNSLATRETREIATKIFPYCIVFGILFFLLWAFGFRIIHSRALNRKWRLEEKKLRKRLNELKEKRNKLLKENKKLLNEHKKLSEKSNGKRKK